MGGKLVSLVRAADGISAEPFALEWREEYLPSLMAFSGVAEHLIRAVHHHAIPSGIRAEDGVAADGWSGVGTYFFDDAGFVDALAVDPLFQALHAETTLFAEVALLPVDALWIYDRDPSHLPLKMFAFFKRKPQLSRAEAQFYYRTTHARVGDAINHNRTVRFVQNHVRRGFTAPDPRHDFDAGPEIWFRSMEIALDLFNDAEAMRILGEDEERFVLRDQITNLLTDERIVWERAG